MYAERYTATLTTDGSGAVTGYLPADGLITGRILSVIYAKVDFANGVDFAITLEQSGLNVWTESNVDASKTVYPVAAAALPSGAASTLTEAPIVAVRERLKIAITNGGATRTGTFTVVVGG